MLIFFAAIINISGHFKLVKGNYRDDGYYRVNYDPESWKAITDQLMTNHEVNKNSKSHDKFQSHILKIYNYHNIYSHQSFVTTHKTITLTRETIRICFTTSIRGMHTTLHVTSTPLP